MTKTPETGTGLIVPVVPPKSKRPRRSSGTRLRVVQGGYRAARWPAVRQPPTCNWCGHTLALHVRADASREGWEGCMHEHCANGAGGAGAFCLCSQTGTLEPAELAHVG